MLDYLVISSAMFFCVKVKSVQA